MPEAVEIPLTKGYVAIVDADDYPRVSQYKWQATVQPRHVYATREVRINGKKQTLRMHREILDAKPEEEVDHIDPGATLDNRRLNLRIATSMENSRNQRKRTSGWTASAYKGVSFYPARTKSWLSRIQVSKKQINLGYYHNERDAALAYDRAAVAHFGEFARLNFG